MSPVGVRTKEKSYKGEDGEENQLAVGKNIYIGDHGLQRPCMVPAPERFDF